MRTITEKILDYLQTQAENTVDLIDTVLSDRRTAIRKARHSIVHGAPEFKTRWADFLRERQKFYSLLNQLKREGLVSKKKYGRGSSWHITPQGRKYLVKMKERQDISVKLLRRVYQRQDSEVLTIVAFDIPERERRKRNWLRAQLVALDFKMLQQSVWFAKIQIPEDFINDLRKYEMVPYIHIFSVSKSGSMARKF